MEKKTVQVGSLHTDPKFVEMRPVNANFVSRYRQAYRSGANMPPMIVEERTNRIISGNHRHGALMAEYGPEHFIEVIFKNYENEKAVLMEFARENATHGNAIDGITKRRLSLALIEEGATEEEVAQIFNITTGRVRQMGDTKTANWVHVIGESDSSGYEPITTPKPVKLGIETTEPITTKQYHEHIKKDIGKPAAPLAEQLIRWLRNGWVAEDEKHVQIFTELVEVAQEYLAGIMKKAM